MIYINAENEYPRHIGDVQLAKPSFKEGDALPTGWVKVEESERPTAGTDQVTVEGFPETVDGVMTQTWTLRDLTQAELDRRDAPANAKAKLIELGLTEAEVDALVRGLVR
jgi:hypothetical protein